MSKLSISKFVRYLGGNDLSLLLIDLLSQSEVDELGNVYWESNNDKRDQIQEHIKISKATFYRQLDELKNRNVIVKRDGKKRYVFDTELINILELNEIHRKRS